MHSAETRQRALALVRSGANDCQVARALGVPRTTVRDWRRGLRVERTKAGLHPCPRRWRPARPVTATPHDYAELPGLYLGDGCMVAAGRVERLRLPVDAKHAGIVDDAEALLRRCFPHARSRARRPTAARPSSSLCTAATCRACSHSTAGGRSTSGRWRSRGGSGPSSGSPRGPSSAAASGSTVRLRQPDGALRLSLIRVLQPLAGHPRRLCRDVRPRRRRASAVRPPHPDLSPRERRDDAPPGWFEGVALR